MGTYFFDTSALVKRYVTEIGSAWVMAQCRSESGHTLIISQATLVEAIATFCRKARQQDISQSISQAERDRNIMYSVGMSDGGTTLCESPLPSIPMLVISVVYIGCVPMMPCNWHALL